MKDETIKKIFGAKLPGAVKDEPSQFTPGAGGGELGYGLAAERMLEEFKASAPGLVIRDIRRVSEGDDWLVLEIDYEIPFIWGPKCGEDAYQALGRWCVRPSNFEGDPTGKPGLYEWITNRYISKVTGDYKSQEVMTWPRFTVVGAGPTLPGLTGHAKASDYKFPNE